MAQASAALDYGSFESGEDQRPQMTVSIFADQAYLRAELADDARATGMSVIQASDLGELLADVDGPALGDVVLVDCPLIDGAGLAGLARLDMHAARIGARLIVSTSIGALDGVFGCLDQSDPEILVAASRAERLIALGRSLARQSDRVRELSDESRAVLLRLTEQVEDIAQKLAQISAGGRFDPAAADAMMHDKSSAFRFDAPGVPPRERLARSVRPPLPDPRLVRKILRQRQLRARFFEGDLFADPAWDMLLDLTAARAEHVRVSVTSLCIASGVPPTTALRWIGQMTDAGLLQRVEDEADRRRAFITLSDQAADAMARYFTEIGTGAVQMI